MTTQRAEAEIPLDSLANRLALARKHAGHLSIREAAFRCGLGRGSWQNWERGASEPRTSDLVTIAEQMGVDFDWLARGGPLSSPPPLAPPPGLEPEPAGYRHGRVLNLPRRRTDRHLVAA